MSVDCEQTNVWRQAKVKDMLQLHFKGRRTKVNYCGTREVRE